MKLIHLTFLAFIFPLVLFAQGGGGDADGGGGPDTTIIAMTKQGFEGSIFSDLLGSLNTGKFNKDLLTRSGFLDAEEVNTLNSIDFKKNGSLVFNFKPLVENVEKSVLAIDTNPTRTLFLGNNSNFHRDLSRTNNWVINLNTATAKPELSKKYEELLRRYKEQDLYDALDQVIRSVGAKIKAGEKKEYDLKALEQFYEHDIQRYLEEAKIDMRVQPSFNLRNHLRMDDIKLDRDDILSNPTIDIDLGNSFNFGQ